MIWIKRKYIKFIKANKLININNYKYLSLHFNRPSTQEHGIKINRTNALDKIA